MIAWLAMAGAAVDARAGLAPSDVVVVVNGSSFSSRTLANHYIALRNIPAINVVVLEDVPNSEVVPVDAFREQILKPLIEEIDRRKLSAHIQCIAYSADFPSAIDISSDLAPLGEISKIYTPRASINALTFLYNRVLSSDAAQYINLDINFYARRPIDHYFSSPAGDATRDAWGEIQQLLASGAHREAADALEKLFKSLPPQFPLAYLSAAEAAQAGDAPRALQLLQQAISAGWNAGGYLAHDQRFDPIRDEPDFQVLEYLLEPTIVDLQPGTGFDARIAWAPNGVAVKDPKLANLGLRYLLSTVLGVTRGGGTTLNEAIASLERAASADATHPQGGFFFCLTGDVRTTTRQPGFERAIADLRELGFAAEVVRGALPKNEPAVLGVQLGAAVFNWKGSGSQLVPGAIAENLTSLGGVMTNGGGQTKLSELIRAGAAGSSGTVTEPYALQPKFPLPQMYVHYARGASLAEAFYLSVTGPYQLLIVGDPLCQPFANPPAPQLDTQLRRLEADASSLQVESDLSAAAYLDWRELPGPASQRTAPLAPAAVSLLFDGISPQVGLINPKIGFKPNLELKPTMELKLTNRTLGYHEVCLRFVADDPLAQRSDSVLPIWLGPPDTIRLTLPELSQSDASGLPAISLLDKEILVRVAAPRAEKLSLWHDVKQIASADGEQAEFRVRLSQLGMGPVRLQAQAEMAIGTSLKSEPVWLQVDP